MLFADHHQHLSIFHSFHKRITLLFSFKFSNLGFPASGEFDLMESSGNRDYHCGKTSRGVDTVQTNLHMGYPGSSEHWSNYTLNTNTTQNYADHFHIYELEWNKNFAAYSIGNSWKLSLYAFKCLLILTFCEYITVFLWIFWEFWTKRMTDLNSKDI